MELLVGAGVNEKRKCLRLQTPLRQELIYRQQENPTDAEVNRRDAKQKFSKSAHSNIQI